MDKLSYFNTTFQNAFQDVPIYEILTSETFCYLIDGPFNIMLKLPKTLVFCLFSQNFC